MGHARFSVRINQIKSIGSVIMVSILEETAQVLSYTSKLLPWIPASHSCPKPNVSLMSTSDVLLKIVVFSLLQHNERNTGNGCCVGLRMDFEKPPDG